MDLLLTPQQELNTCDPIVGWVFCLPQARNWNTCGTILGWIFSLPPTKELEHFWYYLTFWDGSSEHLWYYFGMAPTSDHWAVVQEGQVGAEQGSVSGGFSPGHAVSSTCDKGRTTHLKVPKREIFDRSDFPDFYRIRSSWVGDLVVKILT
jgi:hypothetical protein